MFSLGVTISTSKREFEGNVSVSKLNTFNKAQHALGKMWPKDSDFLVCTNDLWEHLLIDVFSLVVLGASRWSGR